MQKFEAKSKIEPEGGAYLPPEVVNFLGLKKGDLVLITQEANQKDFNLRVVKKS